ncbi:uncharacterized protein HD556DRAFT_234697 [Suillus plorans]|uniref:Uncharacterized protein n=1 Tax=Suillus plorans TaxID=116603 RepID=A0A9P7DLC8_9AGAM|nr:uncharacterized protein HD556DRAFT_234697 [Suillus plorans]KAG1797692.1 hypothetical protein HD556DRAFT_234697 [Suillus plorans]
MVIPTSPSARVPVSADSKTETMAKAAQKGFFSSFFSWSPKRSAKCAIERPSATQALSHAPSEPPAPTHDLSRVQSVPQILTPNLSRVQSAPQAFTPNFPQRKVNTVPEIPRFKSIKDNLRELGLTTPVVLTQPQVAGSEAVLSQLDKVASPRADMFFQHSLSHNTSPTSSKPRHESSRGNALVASDHAINIELPVLNITSANVHFAPLPPSATAQANHADLVEKIATPVSTAPDEAPIFVQGGSSTSNREPPIPSSPSVASRPSISQSNQSHTPSSTRPKRPRTAPGGSSELSKQTSVAPGRPQRHATKEPASIFPVDEGFFGRPKLPPPLKVIPKKVKRHQRTQTLVPSPSPTTMTHEQSLTRAASARSHKTHQTPARLASVSEPAALFPIPNVLTSDKSVLINRRTSLTHSSRSVPSSPPFPLDDELELPPPSPLHTQAPDECSLSRINTRTTVASHQTQLPATPAPKLPSEKWAWNPPSSWLGPSSAVSSESGDSSHSSKKAFSIIRLRRPKSSSRSVASISKSLYTHRNTSSPTLTVSATKFGKGRMPPMVQDKNDSTGVIVKMQSHEGDWEAAAFQDVIPRLREMKNSALSN